MPKKQIENQKEIDPTQFITEEEQRQRIRYCRERLMKCKVEDRERYINQIKKLKSKYVI